MDISGYSKSLVDVGGYFKSLTDASRYLILVEFGKIIKSVESSKFLRYKVDISRNLRRINLSRFPKFQFRVKVVYSKAFLLTTGGGK